jgi:hypothetical protein
MLKKMPVIGIGCVIDQAGYHERYQDRYRDDIWLLCRTAFAICVERAAKYAKLKKHVLRVCIERADHSTDRMLESYYNELKNEGMPFNEKQMGKYCPLLQNEFSDILHEFKPKYKQSISMQIADLLLFPICKSGYESNYRPYKMLEENNKLINQNVDKSKLEELGIKYSCFENVVKIKA